MTPMPKLSDTQRVILSAAAQHENGLARAPKNLPAAARNAVFRSLIKNNLLTEINAPREHVGLGWRQDEDGTWIVARITDEGLRAIGIDPNEGDAVADTAATGGEGLAPEGEGAPAPESAQAAPLTEEIAMLDQALTARAAAPRANLRDAAAAILAAWDDETNRDGDIIGALDAPMEALREALARRPGRPMREPGSLPRPREGTKLMAVLAMLRRPEGATVAQVGEATGWGKDTVRGFFAGLKKKGITVEVAERVRQVGRNRAGSRGSYTVYRVARA